MGIRNVVFEGDPILLKKCRDVTEFGEHLGMLLDDLRETMDSLNAYGISGPHVGILRRIVTLRLKDKLIEVVNPEIVKREGIQIKFESSVSSPGQRIKTVRPMDVVVRGNDRYGNIIEVCAKGLMAMVLCQGIDQTNGIFFKSSAASIFGY